MPLMTVFGTYVTKTKSWPPGFTKTIWVSDGQNSVFFSTNCMCVVSSYFTSTARRWHVCDTHSNNQMAEPSTGLEPTSVLKGSSGERRPPIMGEDCPRTHKTPSTTSKIPRRPHVSTSSHQIDLCGPVYSQKEKNNENGYKYTKMLLCDTCNTEWHIDCLVPPLLVVPLPSWSCHLWDGPDGAGWRVLWWRGLSWRTWSEVLPSPHEITTVGFSLKIATPPPWHWHSEFDEIPVTKQQSEDSSWSVSLANAVTWLGSIITVPKSSIPNRE